MENEHELSYETLTRVYLGSYEHYKGVVAEVEHSKPGFELQGAKMVETGQNRDFRLRTARVTTPGLRFLGASFTQRTVSSISVGGSINLKGFLSSILLSVVIIVTVVIVVVILIVVVVDDVPFILKLSFVIIGFLHGITFSEFGTMFGHKNANSWNLLISWAYAFHQDKASSVKVPVANVTLFSSAHLLRENTDSVRSNQRIRPTAPSVPLKQKAVYASTAVVRSAISCRMAAKVMAGVSDVDVLLGGILSA
ncbi:hypothetical protein Tco_1109622 [Tanacetum coccineum]